MLKKILKILLPSFYCASLLAQSDGIAVLKNVIPPSPNASALARYGDWPVNLYTGVPNIAIPLYDLKTRSLDVPISLSYHAAGNQVGTVASWVGLGWSLNAGGVISRSIRGLPDEDSYWNEAQNYADPNDLASAAPNSIKQPHKVGAANNNVDSQEDSYNFSALGKSYRLLIKADGSVYTIPYSNIKFVKNPVVNTSSATFDSTWTALMEDGTKLVFGGAHHNETNTSTQFGDNVGVIAYVSAWYLKSITSTTGETILFNYDYNLGNQVQQDSYFYNSDYIEYSITANPYCAPPISHSAATSTSAEVHFVEELRLSSIESELCRVELIEDVSERLDLKGGRSLSQIKVYDKLNSQYIDNYFFNYNYSSAVSSNEYLGGISGGDASYLQHRLKLLNIVRKPSISSESMVWTFEYNPLLLPSRRSYAQDYWGFYNGAILNTTLLPKIHYQNMIINNPSVGFVPPQHELGANKYPDEASMQAEILTKIIYPTGGNSKFVYEGNGVETTEELFHDVSITKQLQLGYNQSNFETVKTAAFTITKPQDVYIYGDSHISPYVLNDFPSAETDVEILDGNGNIISGISFTDIASTKDKWINLPSPGNYVFRVRTNVDQSSFGSSSAFLTLNSYVTFSESLGVQSYRKFTGGLRIKNIVTNDATDVAKNQYKQFQYASPLVINPIDSTIDFLTQQQTMTVDASSGLTCYFTRDTRNSSTNFAQGSIQGGTTGYGQVTVLYGPNGENGKTVSTFTNTSDHAFGLAADPKVFPYPAIDSRDALRGLLLTAMDYRQDGQLIRQTDNTYNFTVKGYIVGFKAGYSSIIPSQRCTDQYRDCGISQAMFSISCDNVSLMTTVEKNYIPSTGNWLISTTINHYDNPNNLQPTQIEKTDSKGQVIKIKNRTALEKTDINQVTPLTVTANAAIDLMVSRNIISPILQTEQWITKGITSTLLNRYQINFKQWNPGIVEPELIQVQKSDGLLESRVQFTSYDDKGNLLEQHKSNDVNQVYLYGYKRTYPVAQVVGSDIGTVSGLLDQNVLDNPPSETALLSELNKLRTGLASTKALVTTYTYKPLVGISTQTDPNGKTNYYEYDSFNRLKAIKDKDGNVLKTFNYQYQKLLTD